MITERRQGITLSSRQRHQVEHAGRDAEIEAREREAIGDLRHIGHLPVRRMLSTAGPFGAVAVALPWR
jgi:hypothetical protein